jgi:hypothetical protein
MVSGDSGLLRGVVITNVTELTNINPNIIASKILAATLIFLVAFIYFIYTYDIVIDLNIPPIFY